MINENLHIICFVQYIVIENIKDFAGAFQSSTLHEASELTNTPLLIRFLSFSVTNIRPSEHSNCKASPTEYKRHRIVHFKSLVKASQGPSIYFVQCFGHSKLIFGGNQELVSIYASSNIISLVRCMSLSRQ